MDTINKSVQKLLKDIRKSEMYKEYRKQEELLSKDKELKARVDRFRADNYKLQTATDKEVFLAKVQEVEKESEELAKIPQANAYLAAELAFCQMMQIVCRDLTMGIEMDIPII